MKFTLELLEEISDYIEMLDDKVGLKAETTIDIQRAISKEKDKLKVANDDENPKKADISQRISNRYSVGQSVRVCGNESEHGFEIGECVVLREYRKEIDDWVCDGDSDWWLLMECDFNDC